MSTQSAEQQSKNHYDVAIIGGGPGGTTLGTLLRKYDPKMRVLILEKEKFPRDHVGESQLPRIGSILDEMGVWDKVEAANFPIKIGGTFKWGKTEELWDFDFLDSEAFRDEPRPSKFDGQRKFTAFQIDRAIFDTILLRHAEEAGVEVREEAQVTNVRREGDKITGFELKSGEVITAKYYVDASGHIGVLRRAMGVETEIPTRLQNIAVWYYWQNAEWATHIGTGGTRIQVMSVSDGWIWFIPLSPTRTSIGFVCPQEYYKKAGKSPEELYKEALSREPRISALVKNATNEGKLYTTKDWSFVADRTYGDNWFLVGESAGFADPILSAGMTLTHSGGRELAYVILELERGEHKAQWLKENYDFDQRSRVRQHIRFADFWYAANGQFTDLQAHCAEIAAEAGLKLTGQDAWKCIARGGFTHDTLDHIAIGSFDVNCMKQLAHIFGDMPQRWQITEYNLLKLNLTDAREEFVPAYAEGRIQKIRTYLKGVNRLHVVGVFDAVMQALRQASDVGTIYRLLQSSLSHLPKDVAAYLLQQCVQAMELMLNQGFIVGKLDKKKGTLKMRNEMWNKFIHPNIEPRPEDAIAPTNAPAAG
ncbi:MAG: tryptophan 7-halogenase [Anaerolineae bacterium]|nr:tryptophan 7-halogenase [Phycisphaerae bacterium]